MDQLSFAIILLSKHEIKTKVTTLGSSIYISENIPFFKFLSYNIFRINT